MPPGASHAAHTTGPPSAAAKSPRTPSGTAGPSTGTGHNDSSLIKVRVDYSTFFVEVNKKSINIPRLFPLAFPGRIVYNIKVIRA